MNSFSKFISVGICTLLLFGCSTNKPSKKDNTYCQFTLENFTMPSGIYVDNKIYWQSELDSNIQATTKEKTLDEVSVVAKGCFPHKDGEITKSAKSLKIKSYKKEDNFVSVQTKDKDFLFYYYESMNLDDEVKQFEPDEEGNTWMAAPHFIYNNMMYFTYNGYSIKLPDYFTKVGSIKETFARAKQNFTGNIEVGSELYATDFQNRFMLVKALDDKFYVYENGAYRNSN